MHADSVKITANVWITSERYENMMTNAKLLKYLGFSNGKKYRYSIVSMTIEHDFSGCMRLGQINAIPSGYNLCVEIIRCPKIRNQ